MYSIQWQLFAEIFVRKLTYVSFCSIEFFFFAFLLLAYLHSLFSYSFLFCPLIRILNVVCKLNKLLSDSFGLRFSISVGALFVFFVLFTKFSSFILIYCYLDTELFNFFLSIFCFFLHTFEGRIHLQCRWWLEWEWRFLQVLLSRALCQSANGMPKQKKKFFPSKLSIRCVLMPIHVSDCLSRLSSFGVYCERSISNANESQRFICWRKFNTIYITVSFFVTRIHFNDLCVNNAGIGVFFGGE